LSLSEPLHPQWIDGVLGKGDGIVRLGGVLEAVHDERGSIDIGPIARTLPSTASELQPLLIRRGGNSIVPFAENFFECTVR
jgi:hypothetical protein